MLHSVVYSPLLPMGIAAINHSSPVMQCGSTAMLVSMIKDPKDCHILQTRQNAKCQGECEKIKTGNINCCIACWERWLDATQSGESDKVQAKVD